VRPAIGYHLCSAGAPDRFREDSMLTRRKFAVGDTLIRENDLGETAFIVHEGQVEIRKDVGGTMVHLATVGPGDTIGEMSMIEDTPRSATAVAITPVVADEVHHDDFYQALQTDREIALLLLKSLFERLREANATILQLRSGGAIPVEPVSEAKPPILLIEGLTPEAEQVLPSTPFRVEQYPFRIGRCSHNPLVHNDLEIEDKMPWQISRHHLAFVLEQGRAAVVDRGSTLGTSVDDRRLGGPKGEPGPIFLEGESLITLGKSDSPFRFQVIVQDA
jgi:CRP-like cAMP-binding protein